jgi:hypothetical protein
MLSNQFKKVEKEMLLMMEMLLNQEELAQTNLYIG